MTIGVFYSTENSVLIKYYTLGKPTKSFVLENSSNWENINY